MQNSLFVCCGLVIACARSVKPTSRLSAITATARSTLREKKAVADVFFPRNGDYTRKVAIWEVRFHI